MPDPDPMLDGVLSAVRAETTLTTLVQYAIEQGELSLPVPELGGQFDPETQGSPEGKAIAVLMRAAHAYWVAMEAEPHTHADAEAELAAEVLALSARDLVRAVEAQRPEDRPVGWVEAPPELDSDDANLAEHTARMGERWLRDPSTVDARSIKTPGYVLYVDDTTAGYRSFDNALHIYEDDAQRTVEAMTSTARAQGWHHLSYGYAPLTGLDWEISGNMLRVKPDVVKLSDLATQPAPEFPAPTERTNIPADVRQEVPVTWVRLDLDQPWHLVRHLDSVDPTIDTWCGKRVRPLDPPTSYEAQSGGVPDRLRLCEACLREAPSA